MVSDKNLKVAAGELQGNARELQGNARELQGNDKKPGNVALNEIVETLRENDDAKKELYREIRYQLKENVGLDINPEPYLEKWLGERQDKKMKLEELDIPLRELAENVLGMTEDGYSQSQIAFELGIYRTQVTRILKEREKWEKDIAGAARQHISQNKGLPWYVRLAAKLKLI